ncbi:MAG: SMC-Scp complex subunit ScpB [candidate division KSB1 bacterium]|nr:SMC-Scp complex subunit ScpB [candidate division KSB1 bacterium]
MIDYKHIKQIVEALIFAYDAPLSDNRILKIVEDIKSKDIVKAIDELNAEYESSGRTFRIRTIGGGYQLVTEPEYAKYIRKLIKGKIKQRLSTAALEVLSIIAFKQPISRPEIDQIRGVNSDGVVRTLLERNMITISGRSEKAGKALIYTTTPEFLIYFGINDISDLPKPREMEELLGNAQEELHFSSDDEKARIVEELVDMEEEDHSDDEAE